MFTLTDICIALGTGAGLGIVFGFLLSAAFAIQERNEKENQQ